MASSNSTSDGIPVFDHTPFYWYLPPPSPFSAGKASLFFCSLSLFVFYCEENVYRLCKKLCSTGLANTQGSDLFVVFISNDKKQIPLWHQKASQRADGAVLWDYHVICIQRKTDDSPNLVWDLDSDLSIPCQLEIYLAETVRPSFKLYSEYQRIFRVVHAPSFFLSFASDRRHMKDSAGNWMEEPPPYDPIVAQDGTVHNLNEYMEIKSEELTQNLEVGFLEKVYTEKLGVVISESQLVDFFSPLG